MLATLAALMCVISLNAQTQTVVNVVEQTAQITQTSTLYVGEVLLDGQQSFCYLYSEDMTNSETVFAAVRDGLSVFKDGMFSALVPDILGETEDKGIAVCSNPTYQSMMNSDWTSADKAGLACLSNTSVTSSSSENLFETNADFAAKCTLDDEDIDNYIDVSGNALEVSGILGKLSTSITDAVTYTVIDGKLVKLIDREYDYTCEMTTVIYTKVELESAQGGNTSLTANADDEGNYWATYYNGLASMSADDNTTVYTAKVNADGSKVILTEVTGKIIPAGNAVVMKSLHDKITLTATDAAGILPDNELQGQPEPFNTPDNLYALVKGTHGLGFYHYPATTQFPAQNAYLIISGGNVREYVPFSDGPTGILTVQPADDESAPLYDLTGRKAAAQPRPGIYVRNGKKITVK